MMTDTGKRNLVSLFCGLLFGVGLTLSGMSNPQKVLNFLDISGQWDPTLILVLAGATGITLILYPRVFKQSQPVLDSKFHLPTTTKVEPHIIIGAALFGIGWGVVGYCPGPVFTTLLLGKTEPFIFFAAMISGMAIYRYSNKTAN